MGFPKVLRGEGVARARSRCQVSRYFFRYLESSKRTLQSGIFNHSLLLRCVDWHPHKGIVVSGSKDNQQPIKLWDPKSGQVWKKTPDICCINIGTCGKRIYNLHISAQVLTTIHAHKSTVMDCAWNQNGNWLITASRDHLLKVTKNHCQQRPSAQGGVSACATCLIQI